MPVEQSSVAVCERSHSLPIAVAMQYSACFKVAASNPGKRRLRSAGRRGSAQLLAEVYLQLLGGPQNGLNLTNGEAEEAARAALTIAGRVVRPARPHAASAHAAFVARIRVAVWLS